MKRVGQVIAVCLALWLASMPASAHGQGSTPEGRQSPEGRALELKELGNKAMDSGHPADAVMAYDQALQLSQDPALIYNKGRALQALAQYPEALTHLERFAREAPQELRRRAHGLDVLIAELRQKVAGVRIFCNVPGAKVVVRDRVLGTTPIAGDLKVNAGAALVEISAEGYLPYSQEVNLAGALTTVLKAELASKATHGVLMVKAPVSGAAVEVDDTWRGTVPMELVLPAGTHRVRVEKEGFRLVTTSAVVEAGGSKELRIELEKEPGMLSRWWFWTAAGAVVAGTVSTIVILNTERSPHTGSIPPGRYGVGE